MMGMILLIVSVAVYSTFLKQYMSSIKVCVSLFCYTTVIIVSCVLRRIC